MRRSALVGVATLMLLLTSAMPAAAKLSTLYQLDATCTAVDGHSAELHVNGTRKDVRSVLRTWIVTVPCVRSTVDYTISPASGG